ncbi:hypothetical protein AOQ84DRAFT_88028 [Glonium stellatum]|uniref:Pre-rRNA-processing protein RIX1 n=1 Tax=Glonium stellatum TaxID=574774 RepID=A0A8E2EW87_9PEZI|nr:hypothetical protein AOQ84DRAFT_88028 [Glonium stellatum]
MAPQGVGGSTATLKAITFRIASTPASQLPQQIPAISASLPRCKDLISASQVSSPKDASENAVVIHKYKTQLSTLLQDRTTQGRWTAVVLIKATIEIGGWEVLQKSGPWVRGLLSILTKPDPPTTKKLSIITLTRIFMHTRDYPTLVREITTPSLPTFIQSCLNIITLRGSNPLLHTVLESFNQLLPRHPTIFRTFRTQMQQILVQVLAPTPSSTVKLADNQVSNFFVSSEISKSARQLYIQLHQCAPKAASTEEWENLFKDAVSNVHYVANKVFRAVVEDWQSVLGANPVSNGQTLDTIMEDIGPDLMGLSGWSGVYAGSERMIGLLLLLKELVAIPTATAVNFRLGSLMDLLNRIFSLTVPSYSKATDWQNSVRFNNQISREEREQLWAVLPHIHIAAMEIILTLLERFEQTLNPLVIGILDQLTWIFNAEKDVIGVRTIVYSAISGLLNLSGATLPKSSIDPLGSIIHFCCGDILPQEPVTSQTKAASTVTKGNGNSTNQSAINADTFLGASNAPKTPAADFAGLRAAAHVLLPILLSKLPTQYISDSLRTRMDRTAVLAQHKEAMVASVLNPPAKKSGRPVASIMPLLARSYPHNRDVEGLLRPRMPVIRTGNAASALDDEEDDEQGEEAELDSADDASQESIRVDIENKETAMEEAIPSRLAIGDEGSGAHRSTAITPAQPGLNSLTDTFVDTAPGNVTEKSTKRTQPESIVTPPSPKRVRLETLSQSKVTVPETGLTTGIASATSNLSIEPNSAPQSTTPIVTDPTPLSTTRAAASTNDTDSDNDDDFGALVLGQDSDEED